MSIAPSVRLPDLWLKISMAMALLPSGSSTNRIQNGWFIQCIRGENGRAPLLNQWLAGDLPIRIADDLHLLAGTLECLILGVNPDSMNYATVKTYTVDAGVPILVLGLMGTFEQFASSLDRLLRARPDYSDIGGADHVRRVLGGVVRNELVGGLDEYAEVCGTVHVLHGKQRNWVGSSSAGERIVRQPSRQPIPKKDFVQFVLPPAERTQCVFGFELRLDDDVVVTQWEEAGAWLPSRLQPTGQSVLLFDEPVNDEDAAYVDGDGEFGIRIIAVDADAFEMPTRAEATELLPEELTKLVQNVPGDWPDGYAKSLALVTFVKRMGRRQNTTRARNAREMDRADSFAGHSVDLKPEPTRPRLYRGQYRVA